MRWFGIKREIRLFFTMLAFDMTKHEPVGSLIVGNINTLRSQLSSRSSKKIVERENPGGIHARQSTTQT